MPKRTKASKASPAAPRKGKASAKPTPKPAATKLAPVVPDAKMSLSPSQTRALRDVFWQNVLREMLVSLATISQRRNNTDTTDDHSADVLDGRLGVILSSGKRLGIADVFPVFAAGVGKTALDRALSAAVECTVFQIRTVEGEVYTVPLSQIRGFHALDEDLIARIQQSARSMGDGRENHAEPFGFAAFTSLAKRAESGDLSGAL